jgi:hypothetical protein
VPGRRLRRRERDQQKWNPILRSNRAPLRVSREHELEGLDISRHGEALQ